MINGSVEFDVDFSGTYVGVNANIYTVSPSYISPSGFNHDSQYCDGSNGWGVPWCLEVDWIESNGDCGGATTLHTVQYGGGCNAGGCQTMYNYGGQPTFHMKITYAADGTWVTYRNGQTIEPWNLNPQPSVSDWQIVANTYQTHGAVIMSSQWVGWVPAAGGCPGGNYGGDYGGSWYKITNLKITGSVVQGPTPTLC
jgi:hypothetical protein